MIQLMSSAIPEAGILPPPDVFPDCQSRTRVVTQGRGSLPFRRQELVRGREESLKRDDVI